MNTERVAETFVELADTLVDDFDVVDLLHLLTSRCLELLDVDAAGILLAYPAGRLQVAVSTSESARALDLFQMQDEEGPGLECFYTATPVAVEHLAEAVSRWPRFAKEATSEGFTSVLALPMRLRGDVIGVLNLLARSGTAPVSEPQTRVAQAMADAATVAILQHRLSEEWRLTNVQLERALQSRVVIEQGKGVLASRLQVSEDEAFQFLRQRARATRHRLTDVADEVRGRGPDADWEDYRQAKPSAGHPGDSGSGPPLPTLSNGAEHGRGRAEEVPDGLQSRIREGTHQGKTDQGDASATSGTD